MHIFMGACRGRSGLVLKMIYQQAANYSPPTSTMTTQKHLVDNYDKLNPLGKRSGQRRIDY
jgi:hypothetical protein